MFEEWFLSVRRLGARFGVQKAMDEIQRPRLVTHINHCLLSPQLYFPSLRWLSLHRGELKNEENNSQMQREQG